MGFFFAYVYDFDGHFQFVQKSFVRLFFVHVEMFHDSDSQKFRRVRTSQSQNHRHCVLNQELKTVTVTRLAPLVSPSTSPRDRFVKGVVQYIQNLTRLFDDAS